MKARYWLERAKKEGFALGAFNAGSLESLKAIVAAAKNLASPVIIEASPGEIDYFGLTEMTAAVRAFEKHYQVPIILNLDHAVSFQSCQKALENGFDYIHFDGSKLPLGENTALTKVVVFQAHEKGILVEGEVDAIGGKSADRRGQLANSEQRMAKSTDPEKAKKFVEETGVDVFAAFVGNVHGLYGGEKRIDLNLLKEISQKLPATFLSLHGGSGVPADEIKEAMGLGVVKVNVNSELRVAFHDSLKRVINGPEGDEVAIYKMMPEAVAAVQKVVEEKIRLFGSAGKI